MRSNERPTVTIRLKPYLHEFFFTCPGKFATRKEFIGKILKVFIELRPPDQFPEFLEGPDVFEIMLPLYEDFNLNSNFWISPDNHKLIAKILDRHFKDLFYAYMDDKVRFTKSFKKAILQFCSDYDMTYQSDYYETLKKDYYRDRKRFVKRKNSLSGSAPEMRLNPVLFFLT